MDENKLANTMNIVINQFEQMKQHILKLIDIIEDMDKRISTLEAGEGEAQ